MEHFKVVSDLPESIFRAYDIRGPVDDLTADVVYTIASAFAAEAVEQGETYLAVGRDGRESSPLLAQAVMAGLVDGGVDVVDLGAIPTPLLYFATHVLSSRSGVMITGSHNPRHHNGLKLVLDRQTLASEGIQAIQKRAKQGGFSRNQGHVASLDIQTLYIDRVTQDVRLTKPLTIVIDAGNGVTGNLAPRLFRQMGCRVIELNCEVDGTFPNHHPDPSQVENLTQLIDVVIRESADVGLAFDGDGDRLGIITNKGEIIWPDRQLMAFAREVLSRHRGGAILFDVKCSKYLPQVILQSGGNPIMWKTGHSLIKQKMRETQAILAGEMSGHVFFRDRWYGFDDGLYAGARMLEILSETNLDASTFFSHLPDSVSTPELHIPIDDKEKFHFMEKFAGIADFPEGEINPIDGVRVDFPMGFGLIRCSNTTPNLVLRFEADTKENMNAIQNQFKEQLLRLNPNLKFPF